MRRSSCVLVAWVILTLLSCKQDDINPDKYIIPTQLQATRQPGSIQLKNLSYLMEYSQQSLNMYTPNAVVGERFELFASENDTLDFRKVDDLPKDGSAFSYTSNLPGKNYFFKVKCSARGVKSVWSNLVWVQSGVNREMELVEEIDPYYSFVLSGILSENDQLLYSRNTVNYCCEILSFILGISNGMEQPLDSLIEMPALNADGTRICFASPFDTSAYPEPYNIGILERSTNTITQLTHGYNNFHYPVWSKDEKKIYFLSENTKVHDAWNIDQINIESKEITRLVDAAQFPVQRVPMSVSPTDGKLAFMVRSSNTFADINFYDPNSEEIKAFEPTTWYEFYPSFSHNGENLAFLSTRSGLSEIWITNLKTKQTYQLTSSDQGSPEGTLIWAGDDSKIYFKGYYQSKIGIFSININP